MSELSSRRRKIMSKRAEAVSRALRENSDSETPVRERIITAPQPPPLVRRERSPSPPVFSRGGGVFDVPNSTPKRVSSPSLNYQTVSPIPTGHKSSQPVVVAQNVQQQQPPPSVTAMTDRDEHSGRRRGGNNTRYYEQPEVTVIKLDTAQPPIATAPSPRFTTSGNGGGEGNNSAFSKFSTAAATSHNQMPPPPPIAPSPPQYQPYYYPPPPYQPQMPMPHPYYANTEPQQQQKKGGKGKRERPNYSLLPPHKIAELKNQFYSKFLILQRNFPNWSISLPADGSSLDYMHDLYDTYVKQVTISQSSTQFTMLLVVVFCGIEFGATKFGVDISGYAESQIRTLHRYEGVLIELGEKYSGDGEGEWPVEVRIIAIALVQAGIFCLAKYVEKWLGAKGIAKNIHSTIDSMLDNLPLGNGTMGNGGEQEFDELGLPIAPGTGDEIRNVERGMAEATAAGDDDVASALAGNGIRGARPSPPLQKQQGGPSIDLGGIGNMLGGLLGAKQGGDGGVDVAGLVGGAMKMLNGLGGGANGAQRTSPTSPTAGRTSPTSPTVGRTSPPRSMPRKAPVFHDE